MNSGPLGKDWFGDCQDVLGKMMQFCTLVWFEMILWAIAAVNIYWKGLMEWSSVGWVGAVLCLWCSKRFEKWQWLEKGGEAHENRFPVFMALLEYIMSKELGIPSFNSREELSHPAFIIFSIRNFEFCYKMEKKKELTDFHKSDYLQKSFLQSISSVQFSHSVVSDSFQPHGLQHTRPPCPSPTPGAYSNSCPLSQWCHPTSSFSVVPFYSCLQSFPASRSFPRSQFFISGGQSIGVSVSASALPMNIQDWFPLAWTGWIFL